MFRNALTTLRETFGVIFSYLSRYLGVQEDKENSALQQAADIGTVDRMKVVRCNVILLSQELSHVQTRAVKEERGLYCGLTPTSIPTRTDGRLRRLHKARGGRVHLMLA